MGGIIAMELVFYVLLTQFRIPPWEIAAFLIVNIDLTLTFEGREGALTKPLRHNPLYICICKPVAEMFTRVTSETENYYQEKAHARTQTHKHIKKNIENAPWHKTIDKNNKNVIDPHRQKLLIAPAHYVYRFLESVFEIFCVLTYGIMSVEVYNKTFVGTKNITFLLVAVGTTILTPVLYCTVCDIYIFMYCIWTNM